MKPNYEKKVTGKNYKIGHRYGNAYFEYNGTRRINELLINGYVVRFIPHYSTVNFNFPPKVSDFESINWNPKNMEEARVFSFNFADLVFFEYNEKEGESFHYCYSKEIDDHVGLIHCINSEKFKELTDEMQRKMPYILHKKGLKHHMHHDDISEMKFIQFLDTTLIELNKLLPSEFRKSLE